MNIDFHSRRFALPPALTDPAWRRVHLTLMHRSESDGIHCRAANRPGELPHLDSN